MTEAIWLIAGGPMQAIAAKKIKELGFHLILSDGSPDPYCKKIADTFVQIDTFSVDAHIEKAKTFSTQLKIKAVLTTAADCHGTVARLAKYLGLPHLSPEISDICRDKSLTRNLLSKVGLLQPKSFKVESYLEAQKVLENYSLNFVIKATDNSGSRGFAVIDKKIGLSEEQFNYSLSMGTTGAVILEERLLPDPTQVSEASVETIWCQGKMYWINWVDRLFSSDLKFFPQISLKKVPGESIEVGHINPAHRSFQVKKVVFEDIFRAGCALGMDKESGAHILKADIFFSDKGPVILEMTPRTSGGWDSSGSSIARGADIPGGIIQLALGASLSLDVWMEYFNFKDCEKTAVVISSIPENAKDCVGRQFAIAEGYGPIDEIITRALQRAKKGEYIVPLH